MAQILVADSANGALSEAGGSWNWVRAGQCTAAMLIEERIRAEFDRIRSGHPASAFLSSIGGPDPDRIADRLVARALEDFSRGRLLLIVDDRQLGSLDAPVSLDGPIEAVFLRLTPLKGG